MCKSVLWISQRNHHSLNRTESYVMFWCFERVLGVCVHVCVCAFVIERKLKYKINEIEKF